jgi:hypothetical protein
MKVNVGGGRAAIVAAYRRFIRSMLRERRKEK